MQHVAAKLRYYFPYVMPLASFAALVFLLNKTNPLHAGPAWILLVFVLAYLFVVSVVYLLLTLGILVLAYFVTIGVGSRRKIYYVASILALMPVFLLALNSIGQLQIKDFALVVCLVLIACFYVVKRA